MWASLIEKTKKIVINVSLHNKTLPRDFDRRDEHQFYLGFEK